MLDRHFLLKTMMSSTVIAELRLFVSWVFERWMLVLRGGDAGLGMRYDQRCDIGRKGLGKV